jgi:hypothetical protein
VRHAVPLEFRQAPGDAALTFSLGQARPEQGVQLREQRESAGPL